MASKDYKQNGQYNLKRVELILPSGDSLDLKTSFLDISLYESLITPTMSGSISIIDSANTYNSELLGNGEEIHIDFETAGSSNNISYYGVVYKSSPPTRLSEHASGIILYFSSKERITSSRMIVSDAFNNQSSEIVKTLFGRIKNKKNIDIRQTKNIHKFVPASHSPFQIIGDLASKSISSQNEYGYLFYEDNKQFNFKPIQYLYTQNPITQYAYKNAGYFKDVNKKEEESFNSIQDYEIVSVSDLLQQIDDGVLGSTSVNLNILEKSIVTNTYDNVSAFDKNKSSGKTPNMRDLTNPNKTDIKEIEIGMNNAPSDKARFYNIKEILNSQRYAAKISVFGDTSTKAGDIIICALPVWGTDAQNNDKVPDPYSGRCLVFGIKHTIQKTKYTQSLKLVKNAFEVGQ
jgi:hypothetical protein